MWGPGRKMAFGAAPGSKSKLWYTLADGALSEVFFPSLDRVALHELRFFASASGAPSGRRRRRRPAPHHLVRARHARLHRREHPPRVPPDQGVLLRPRGERPAHRATFTPELPDVRLYMQASAHWQPGTEGNFGQVLDTHPPALLMRQQDVWICIVGPFSRATIGYFQSSDLQIDLHDGDGHLTNPLRPRRARATSPSAPSSASGPAPFRSRSASRTRAPTPKRSRATSCRRARATCAPGLRARMASAARTCRRR